MSSRRPSLKGVKDGTRLEWKVHPENKDEVEILFAGQRSFFQYEEKWRNINLEIIIARHGSACIEVIVFDADFGEENTRIFLSIDALLQAFHTELELRLAEQKELCLRKKKEFEVQTVTDIIVDQLIIEYCFTKLRATGEVPMEAEEGNSESAQKSAHPNDFAVAIPGCNCDPPEGLHKLEVSYRKSAELHEIIHVKKKFQLEKQSFGELKKTTNLLTSATGGFASAATTSAKHQLLLHHHQHRTTDIAGTTAGTAAGTSSISNSLMRLRWKYAVQQVMHLNGLIKAKNRLLQSSWRDWFLDTLSPVHEREVRAFGRFLNLYEKVWPNMKGRRKYHSQHRSVDSFSSTNTSSSIHSRSSSYDSGAGAGDTMIQSPSSTAQSNSRFFPDALGLPPVGLTASAAAAGMPAATSISPLIRSNSVKDRIMTARRRSSKQQHHHPHPHHCEGGATGAVTGTARAGPHISERMFCRLDSIPTDIPGAPYSNTTASLSSSCSLSRSSSEDGEHDPLQHGIYIDNGRSSRASSGCWGSSDGIAITTSTRIAAVGTADDDAGGSSKSDATHNHITSVALPIETTVSNREDRWERLSERTKRRAQRSLDEAEFHHLNGMNVDSTSSRGGGMLPLSSMADAAAAMVVNMGGGGGGGGGGVVYDSPTGGGSAGMGIAELKDTYDHNNINNDSCSGGSSRVNTDIDTNSTPSPSKRPGPGIPLYRSQKPVLPNTRTTCTSSNVVVGGGGMHLHSNSNSSTASTRDKEARWQDLGSRTRHRVRRSLDNGDLKSLLLPPIQDSLLLHTSQQHNPWHHVAIQHHFHHGATHQGGCNDNKEEEEEDDDDVPIFWKHSHSEYQEMMAANSRHA